MAGWLYLAGASIGLWFTWQAVRPARLPRRRAIPAFFAGWLTAELVFHHYAWQAAASAGFIAAGALGTWPGRTAAALTLLQWAGNALLVRDIRHSRAAAESVRAQAGWPAVQLGPHWRRWIVLPRARHPAVESRWHQHFARVGGQHLRLDIHRPRGHRGRAPALVYVHGGGWVLGFRERQGLPLMMELAARGWVCVNADYRLSPMATFPDHLVDVKRAIAWVRAHADELGVDPQRIVVSGNSAGGHLAALAALTAHRRDLQPGFEDADTSVVAAVPFYGVYDLRDLGGHHGYPEWIEFLERYVLKAFVDEDPDRWALASPIEQAHGDAPPMLLVHGTRDTLAPIGAARDLVRRLEEAGARDIHLLEVPGAQHAFEVFPSVRTRAVLATVIAFLEHVTGGGSTVGPPDREGRSAAGRGT